RPQQGEDLALADFEVQLLQRLAPALIGLGQALDGDDWRHGTSLGVVSQIGVTREALKALPTIAPSVSHPPWNRARKPVFVPRRQPCPSPPRFPAVSPPRRPLSPWPQAWPRASRPRR